MAKIYLSFADPVPDTGKLSVDVKLVVVGEPRAEGIGGFTQVYDGEPSATQIINLARNRAVEECNALADGVFNPASVILFCAPS